MTCRTRRSTTRTSIEKVIWTVPKLGYPLRVAVGPIGIFVGGLLVAALAWVVLGSMAPRRV